MSSGEAESTRTRLLAECIIQANAVNIASRIATNNCNCPVIPQPKNQLPTSLSEHNYTLNKAVACPVLYNTPFATFGCQPVYTAPIPYLDEPGTEPPQGPAVTNVYRQFPRIGGIEQISKPLVGRSCNDRTARLKAGILAASDTRYVQSVLPIVPYPPCPQPPSRSGIPIAPNPGCNLGTRRVDYSNPRAN
jgi:hypothetical protein